jgi:hypothetical protein
LTTKNFAASMLFIQFMVSDEGQQLLANYGTSTFGQPLFAPFVPLASNPASNATLLSWIQNYAYIPPNATECPAQYRYNASSLYTAPYDVISGTGQVVTTMAPYLMTAAQMQMAASYGIALLPPLLTIYAATRKRTQRKPSEQE